MENYFGAAFHGPAHEGGAIIQTLQNISWEGAAEELKQWASDKKTNRCTRCKQDHKLECGHFWVLLDKIPYETSDKALVAQDVYFEFSRAMLEELLPPLEAGNRRFLVLRRPEQVQLRVSK